jgi:hypothetical protein
MKRLYLFDDDGERVFAGDTVRFDYGIPPVVVDAKIVQRRGQLIALTPGHDPAECNLRSLRKYVGNWYKPNSHADGSRARDTAERADGENMNKEVSIER